MSDQVKERWLPVVGFEGEYEVSSLGRLRRSCSGPRTYIGRLRKPALSTAGYPFVRLLKNGRPVSRWLHRMVLEAFVGPPTPERPWCNHKNGNRADPRLENLEWVSPSENAIDRYKRGRMPPRGEQHHAAKLTDEDVSAIRHAPRVRGCIDRLATKYKVSRANIQTIRAGYTWRHVA